MPPIKLIAKVGASGKIEITDLPYKEGQAVQVIIQPIGEEEQNSHRYPLRHTQPYHFDDPFSPVAVEEWKVCNVS